MVVGGSKEVPILATRYEDQWRSRVVLNSTDSSVINLSWKNVWSISWLDITGYHSTHWLYLPRAERRARRMDHGLIQKEFFSLSYCISSLLIYIGVWFLSISSNPYAKPSNSMYMKLFSQIIQGIITIVTYTWGKRAYSCVTVGICEGVLTLRLSMPYTWMDKRDRFLGLISLYFSDKKTSVFLFPW